MKKPEWETPEEFEAWRRAEAAKCLHRLRGVRSRAWESWYRQKLDEALEHALEMQRFSPDPWEEAENYVKVPWWKYEKLKFGPNAQPLMPTPLFGVVLTLVTAIIGIPLGMLSWWLF